MTNATTPFESETCKAAYFAGYNGTPLAQLGYERGSDERYCFSAGKTDGCQGYSKSADDGFVKFVALQKL